MIDIYIYNSSVNIGILYTFIFLFNIITIIGMFQSALFGTPNPYPFYHLILSIIYKFY